MTDRLYYDDSYLRAWTAHVVRQNDCKIILDRTAFYPASGGQPFDLGTIGGAEVLEVRDEGGEVIHVVSDSISEQEVACSVDWPRRYDHMQQHSGQHLLSAVISDLFGFVTLSFHLGPEVSTIELETSTLTDGQAADAEDRANSLVREARSVSISYSDANEAQALRKASARSGELRIITMEGCDRSACGGTHVHSTAEIGPLQILAQEKVRGHVRLEFVCGERALRRTRFERRLLQKSAALAGVRITDLPPRLEIVLSRLTEAEKTVAAVELEAARSRGSRYHDLTLPDADGIRRVFLQLPLLHKNLRATMQAFTEQGRALMLATDNDATILLACSSDSGVHADQTLKEILSRGGGSATLAQGRLPDAARLPLLLDKLGMKDPGHRPAFD